MCGLLNIEVTSWVRYTATRMIALVPTVTVAVVSQASERAPPDCHTLLLRPTARCFDWGGGASAGRARRTPRAAAAP